MLTFYTYPLMTGLFGWLTGHERSAIAGALARCLCLSRPVLALDVSGGSFCIVGTSWALLDAMGFPRC